MSEEIENSLLKTIGESSLDITPDILELGLEELTQNEVVAKLPVIGTLVSFGKGVVAIRDWFFVKNILAFLRGLHSVAPEKRKNWLDQLQNDNFQAKVGEELLSLIDKINDSKKNEIAGRIFAAYLEERITYDRFVQLAEKLDRLFSSDITLLRTSGPRNDDEKERYRSIGLYRMHYPGIKRPEAIAFSSRQELLPSDDGILLVEIIRQD